MITKEQAVDILEKFYFFQGQRAGRELWNDKPFDIQEKDIADFARDCQLLLKYVMGERATRFTVIDNETGLYPDCEYIAFNEEWAKHLIYSDIDAFAINEDGVLMLLDDCGNAAFCPADRFTVIFEKGGEE